MPRRGRPVTRPIIKKPGAPGGFVPIPYPNAIDIAATRIADILQRHGDGAIGLVGEGPAPAGVAVESEVVLLAASDAGGVVQLLVESGWTADVPEAGLRRIRDARELVRAIEAGELKGLVSVCFDPPGAVPLARALDKLEFHLAVDTVLGRVARRADVVLPPRPED